MKKIIAITLAGMFPLVSHAITLDLRGGYKEASHTYESRFKMSQGWSNGFWISMETDNKQGNESVHQTVTDYNEIESNYKYKLTSGLTIIPGMVYHWSSAGTQLRPYIKMTYSITPGWYTAARYRYDWNQYDSRDIHGNYAKGSVNRIDLYLGWKNENWMIQDNPVWYSHVNDFNYNNNKRQSWENDVVIKYNINKTWSPYIEWDYLSQQGAYRGCNDLTENRYRVGVSINL